MEFPNAGSEAVPLKAVFIGEIGDRGTLGVRSFEKGNL